jgi:hypothetical protein
MVGWLGLNETVIQYDRQPRVAGTTKYSILKMLRFAWIGISSFSALPLRISMYFGTLIALGGAIYALYSIYAAFVLKETVPGWTSLIVLNVIFSGAILIAIGLVGDYLARIYESSNENWISSAVFFTRRASPQSRCAGSMSVAGEAICSRWAVPASRPHPDAILQPECWKPECKPGVENPGLLSRSSPQPIAFRRKMEPWTSSLPSAFTTMFRARNARH